MENQQTMLCAGPLSSRRLQQVPASCRLWRNSVSWVAQICFHQLHITKSYRNSWILCCQLSTR
ncbi:unnamed protein product, partial [Gulo gulo]